MRHFSIPLAFILVLTLSILPVPTALSLFRPSWVLLLVLYLNFYLPGHCGPLVLLIVGLLMDVLLATVIGEHAFALTAVIWLASSQLRRFQLFPMTQQMVLIGLFCFLYQGILSFIDALLGFNYSLILPFTSAALGAFFWPWIRIVGDDVFLMKLGYGS